MEKQIASGVWTIEKNRLDWPGWYAHADIARAHFIVNVPLDFDPNNPSTYEKFLSKLNSPSTLDRLAILPEDDYQIVTRQ